MNSSCTQYDSNKLGEKVVLAIIAGSPANSWTTNQSLTH